MLASNIEPDVVTFNTMINLYVKIQHLPEAFALFEQMKSRKIDPTIITYTSLIDGCGKCNSFEKALELYAEVQSLGIPPNAHFFNALLNAAFLNHAEAAVDGILRDLGTHPFRKNTVTFNTLVSGFFRMKNLRKIYETVTEMAANDVEFVPATQSNLLRCLQLIRSKDDVQTFVVLLRAAGITPTEADTFQSVADLTFKGQLNLAVELVRALRANGCAIGAEGLRAIVRLAGEFANFVALKWIDDEFRGIDLRAEQTSAQLSTYAKFGNLDVVQAMYSDAVASVQSRLEAIQCMLSHGADAAVDAARRLVLDSTFSSSDADRLLQMVSDTGHDAAVIELFGLIKRNIVRMGTQGSDCVIKAFIKTRVDPESVYQLRPSLAMIIKFVETLAVEAAAKIRWNAMIENCGTTPVASDLFELMNSLMTKQLHTVAWFAFSHFVKLGVSPSANSIELALQSQSETNHHENLVFLLETARESGSRPSSDLANRVLISAIENGNLAQAFQIQLEMESSGVELNDQAHALCASSFGSRRDGRQGVRPVQLVKEEQRRTKLRSRTLPSRKADHCSGMEEISYRSAVLAVGIDEL
jgi:pentatricopeptide repeat protein